MKIRITSFADAGNFQKERIVLRPDSDIDIGEYAILCTALSANGAATAGKKTAYWFPDGEVKRGDYVVLYSKKGTSSTKELDGGRTAHFFYWGSDHSMWGGDGNGAVLLRVAEWSKSKPNGDGE